PVPLRSWHRKRQQRRRLRRSREGGIMGRRGLARGHFLAALTVTLFASFGAEAAESAPSGANTAWILTATALVLLMTMPGLALFYAGLVRAKNVLSVLTHCVVIAAAASILWLVVVYGLVFGDGGT